MRKNWTIITAAEATFTPAPRPQFENCAEPCQTGINYRAGASVSFDNSQYAGPLSMLATHNKSVATEESLRFSLRDLAPPLLRRKRTLSVTFLFVVSVTLLLGHMRFLKHQSRFTPNVTITIPPLVPLLPEHSSAVLILSAVILGVLIGLSLTYLVDYRDPCFHSPVQVIRRLRVPLVVAVPKSFQLPTIPDGKLVAVAEIDSASSLLLTG